MKHSATVLLRYFPLLFWIAWWKFYCNFVLKFWIKLEFCVCGWKRIKGLIHYCAFWCLWKVNSKYLTNLLHSSSWYMVSLEHHSSLMHFIIWGNPFWRSGTQYQLHCSIYWISLSVYTFCWSLGQLTWDV